MHLLRSSEFWIKVASILMPAITALIVVRITHRLSRRMADYQAALSSKMADYQADLNRGLEDHKRDINKELENQKFQLQSDFQISFYAFQTRYSLHHQKRAEAIEKLFALLAGVQNDCVPAVRKLDSAFRHPDCPLCGNLAHTISATGRDLA